MKISALTLGTCLLAMPVMAQYYGNPPEAENQKYRNNPCSDPWVTQALMTRITGGLDPRVMPTSACDTRLYNGGRWSNFNELTQYVERVWGAWRSQVRLASDNVQGVRTVVAFSGNLALSANRAVAIGALRTSSSMVAAGGGNMVAAGAGNMVAAGAGNMVAAGGGNMVAAGGGNMVAAGGGNYRVMSGARKVITLGNGQRITY